MQGCIEFPRWGNRSRRAIAGVVRRKRVMRVVGCELEEAEVICAHNLSSDPHTHQGEPQPRTHIQAGQRDRSALLTQNTTHNSHWRASNDVGENTYTHPHAILAHSATTEQVMGGKYSHTNLYRRRGSSGGRRVCPFYVRGECRKGQYCEDLHPEPARWVL